jgi:hypothetical protein
MSQKIRCANPDCRRLFLPDPRVKGQRYCSKTECRRARKRQWQRQKIKEDPDYRDNQRDAQQCWVEQNRGYWRRYRDRRPGYVKRNRILQRERDRRRRLASLAKMDASKDISSIKPGSYYLIPAKRDLAKMDLLSPKYFLIPHAYPFLAKKDSIDGPPFSGLGCTKKEVAGHDGENHPLPRPGP